jgi:hypothetical protein
MRYKFLLFLLLISLFLIFPHKVLAQVVINEIDPSDEWVELYNIDPTDISLDGCTLQMDKTSESQKITFTGSDTIAGSGYKVIEKETYNWKSNWLNNDGDTVILVCSWGSDSIPYGDDGGVCKPETGESVGRYPDADPTIERFRTPTKGAPNIAEFDSCPTPTPEPTEEPTATPTPTPTPSASPKPTAKAGTPTARPTADSGEKVDEETTNSLIMGLRDELAPSTSPTPEAKEPKKNYILPILLILGGIGCIGGGGAALFKKLKTDYNEKQDAKEENLNNP